jgi:hypothetical protein
VQKGPLTGYVPDFSEYVLGPVPLPRPVPRGISVQALGTFGFQLTNLALAPPEAHDAVVNELGIPRHALLYQVTLIEPLGWQDVTLEVVGTGVEPTDPPEAPRFTDGLSEAHPFTIIAWRRRVIYQKSPPWLEARWHPATGERLDVCGVDAPSPTEVAKFYAKSRRLLQLVSARGRPRRLAYFANAEDLQDTILRIMRQMITEGRYPSQEEVVQYLDVRASDRRLRDWLKQCGLQWKDLLQRAYRHEISS